MTQVIIVEKRRTKVPEIYVNVGQENDEKF
jgi:hypothetical protein